MLGNYALSLYRTLTRHRLYAILNSLALALGLAVCLVLILVVRFETSFDRWIPDARNIYRIDRTDLVAGRAPYTEPSTQGVLLPVLQTDFPQMRASARLMDISSVVRSSGRQAYERTVFADPSIFDVFDLPFVAGSPRGALADLSSLVISREMARKYFGTDQAIGKELTILVDGIPRNYRVTGVLKDLPPNTHLNLGLIARYSIDIFPQEKELMNRWGNDFLFTYVRLRSAADAAAMQQALPAFIDRRVTDDVDLPRSQHLKYRLVPLPSIHFADAKIQGAFKPGADPLFVAALGIMGVATLLIAISNYVSLATARSGMRAREVAVRKVVGATRRALILQFVAEAVVMALLSGLIGAALAEIAMPGVRVVLGEPVRLTYFGPDGVVLPLVLGCLIVGLISGLYPALVLSGFRPAAVLASARAPGGGRAGTRVREGLAIFQFAVAITLMICTSVVFVQMDYLRHVDVGFRRESLLVIRDTNTEDAAPKMAAMMDSLRRIPGVVSVAASTRRPATDTNLSRNGRRLDMPSINPTLTYELVSPGYFDTYGVRVVAGRPLGTAYRLDDLSGHKDLAYDLQTQINVVINEKAQRALGYPTAQAALSGRFSFGRRDDGRPMVATIVGVARDVRFLSPHQPADPQVYMEDTRLAGKGGFDPWSIAVRLDAADRAAVTRKLEQIWRAMVPTQPLRAESAQAALQPYYDPDARRGQLFAIGALLSAVIACLGLYGLAAFNTSRRFKEIGIRKTLGASTADVLRLLIGEFLRPVLWANVIAWPVAWLAMRWWLAGFDQRIDLNPAYFLVPSLAAVLVAVLTVAEQAVRVSRAEPSRALRYE
jgi:putative ABC transport system permease protein